MTKSGWSKPLSARFNMNRFELASAMQAGFDASGLNVRTGRLRAELGKQRNYRQISGRGRNVRIAINIPLAYAAIQNDGGTSPFPRVGTAERKRMRMPWGWRMRRKASKIKGAQYLQLGVDIFCQRFNIGNAKSKVVWV